MSHNLNKHIKLQLLDANLKKTHQKAATKGRYLGWKAALLDPLGVITPPQAYFRLNQPARFKRRPLNFRFSCVKFQFQIVYRIYIFVTLNLADRDEAIFTTFCSALGLRPTVVEGQGILCQIDIGDLPLLRRKLC